jgi:hypothetical protein
MLTGGLQPEIATVEIAPKTAEANIKNKADISERAMSCGGVERWER